MNDFIDMDVIMMNQLEQARERESGHGVSRQLINPLGSALRRAQDSLGCAPLLLKRVLSEGSWRAFETDSGEVVHYERFTDFVTEEHPRGLGMTVEDLRRFMAMADDVAGLNIDALDMLDQALREETDRA